MKKTLRSVVVIGTLLSGVLSASWEYRTPLSARWRGYFHWQLPSVADAWWYEGMPSEKENTTWDFHTWGVAYTRTAATAFWKENNHTTRDTLPLSVLTFGKDVFRGEEAFTGGTFANQSPEQQALLVNNNPFLGFAKIAPQYDYNENGAFLGIEFSRNFGSENQWHVGGRISMPYVVIEVEQENDYKLEETLADVASVEQIALTDDFDTTSFEYALRLDFLSTMNFNSVSTPTATQNVVPVVNYAQGTIAGVDVSGTNPDQGAIGAYFVKSDNGNLPAVPFRKLPNQVTGSLGVNGEAAQGEATFMQEGLDYAANLGTNRQEQSTLFVVPRAEITTDGTASTAQGQALYDTLEPLLNSDLNNAELASEFFLNNGINLAGYSRNAGIGDLLAEVYGGYGDKQNWFVDGLFAISFPTGKRQKSSNDLYFKPTGNNGHFELKLGIDTGWRPCSCFAFEFDIAYHHAFKRSEKRAAAFEGATIVNLGPELDADVSWNYFVGRIDLNAFHPHNPDLGMTFGYELFVKGHDKVSFDQETATDLLGRPDQPLNADNYENRTKALSNKLRAQIFNRWSYFEVFAGGSQVLSGKSVMRETEAHIGFIAYF